MVCMSTHLSFLKLDDYCTYSFQAKCIEKCVNHGNLVKIGSLDLPFNLIQITLLHLKKIVPN